MRRRKYYGKYRKKEEIQYPNHLMLQTCVCAALFLILLGVRQIQTEPVQAAVSTLRSAATTEIDLEDGLGKLSYVSSIIPRSVQVFWNGEEQKETLELPFADGELLLEKDESAIFEGTGGVLAGGEGEVTRIVKDAAGYSLSILYTNGFLCTFEPLQGVRVAQGDSVSVGQNLAQAYSFGDACQVRMRVESGGKYIPVQQWTP